MLIKNHNSNYDKRSGKGFKCWQCGAVKDDIKFLEKVYGGMCSRWKCQKCGATFRYDEMPPMDAELLRNDKKAREFSNPMKSFTRGLKKI